jgi:hypothetical protein
MDEKRAKEIRAWLDKQPWEGPCPVCGTSRWTLGEDLLQVLPLSPLGEPPISGRVYPFFALLCSECGYTMLFNAVVAGLLPPSDDESDPESEADGKGLEE